MIAYVLLATGGPWTGVGVAFIWIGLFALLWVCIDTYGGVQMGPDPQPREVETQEIQRVSESTYVWPTSLMPNWTPVVAEFVRQVDETAAAVIDISDTIEIKPVDPFAASTPTEVIDYSTPLFHTIRRPSPPPRLETHTEAWSRDGLLARIREAAEEMAP